MKFKFDRDHLLNLETSLKQEYLLTNGRGGYAASTILDCHTRKYHSLLAVPVPGTGTTWNLLSKLETTAVIGRKEFRLATNKFPNVFHPTGHKYAESFEYEHVPVTRYLLGDAVIEKSLIMPRGRDAVMVKLAVVRSSKPVVFRAVPLLAYRDIHALAHQNMDLQPHSYTVKNGMKVTPYNHLPTLYIQTSTASHYYPAPDFWNDFEYLKERNRGYPYAEDLFTPGVFEVRVRSGGSVIFRASTTALRTTISTMWRNEEERLRNRAARFAGEKDPLRDFKIRVEDFVLEDGRGPAGIIAGYHWFKEWGRDTMIALAGSTFCRGDLDGGLAILRKYARLQQDGLMPNFLDDGGDHAYNSIDASLLYIRAAQQYLEFGGDIAKARRGLRRPMEDVVRAFLDGRVPCADIGEDGLLYAGDAGTQLTWMDARSGGVPVTPRHGAAVEINALWYNALSFLLTVFGRSLAKDLKPRIEDAARRFEATFPGAFWNEEAGCLCDVYRGDGDRDPSIRPNQLFALALTGDLISPERRRRALDTVQAHLLTPYGLRTLSPGHPDYKFTYTGDPSTRDRAYHQGMVWPWLVGIYTDALLTTESRSRVAAHVRKTFRPLLKMHPGEACLFHISEILTPNPPQVPKGAVAQAWSMAEIIRMLEIIKPRSGARS